MAKRTTKRSDVSDTASPVTTRAKAPAKAVGPATSTAPKATRASRAKGAPSPEPGEYQPTSEEIATRAYFRHLERGGTPGADFDDWVAAEADLKAMHAAARAAQPRARKPRGTAKRAE